MPLENGGNNGKRYRPSTRPIAIAIVAGAVVIGAGLAIGLGVGLQERNTGTVAKRELCPTNGTGTRGQEDQGKQNVSASGKYRYAAVSTNAGTCSTIGIEVMARQRGHVVDATVATRFCESIMNAHNAGIGGGAFFVYYDRKTKAVTVLNARETAPGNTTQDMFVADPGKSTFGGMAVGIPGEVKGLWYLHQKYGRVPWATLIQPTIDLCKNGAPLTRAQQEAAITDKQYIVTNPEFSFLFDSSNEVVPVGTIIRRPKLAHTLEIIAAEGANAMYNGTLTDTIVDEIQEAGGIITRQDLENYRADIVEPIVFGLPNGLTLYSMPPPGSGVVLAYILNILSGYNFNADSVSTPEKTILTYHRIVEAMKFAYAKRTALGDARFVNVSELVRNMTSSEFGASARAMIDDNMTHNTSYYGPTFYMPVKRDTSHMSFMDVDGNVMAVTSTINTLFGSKVKGKNTGIIYNNQMDDFSTPNTTNFYGVPSSESNFIRPGKRPQSSMSPSVIVNTATGEPRLVIGAAGGTLITTSTALTTIHTLWLNKTLTEAVSAPRVHHQLLPPQLMVEAAFPDVIKKGLEAKGHMTGPVPFYSFVHSIARTRDNMLEAVADWREGGAPDGY